MRNLLSVVLILSLAAGPLAAQTSEWKTYKNTSGNFTVLFPGRSQQHTTRPRGNTQSHTLLAREGSAVYTVVYTVMTNAQTVNEATFQAFKEGVFKELPKCEAGARNSRFHRRWQATLDMPTG